MFSEKQYKSLLIILVLIYMTLTAYFLIMSQGDAASLSASPSVQKRGDGIKYPFVVVLNIALAITTPVVVYKYSSILNPDNNYNPFSLLIVVVSFLFPPAGLVILFFKHREKAAESVKSYSASESGIGTMKPQLNFYSETERNLYCQKCGALMPESKANRRWGVCKSCRREQTRGQGDYRETVYGHAATKATSFSKEQVDLQQAIKSLESGEFSSAVRQAMEDRDQAARDEWVRQGRPGAGQSHRCKMCGKTVYGEETVIQMQKQAIYGNAGGPLAAQQWEKNSGYRCKSCGSEYCKDCLEKKAPGNIYGGKSCPRCGGLFEIIHG